MATIASLAVNLIAQTNRFTQPLKSAERTVKVFNSTVEKTTDRLKRVEDATAKARTRFLALKAALAVATHQATQYAGAVIAVHQQTGLSVESVQALRMAAERSSTDIKTLEMGLRSLVRRAAEARQGNLSFAKGFDRLGVSVTRADGSLKDTETLLMEIADGAQRMATEAEASAALMLVMGDAGRRLVPFMRQGSAGIRDLMNEAVAMGIVMDERAIRALDALGDRVQVTGNRFGAMSRDMAYRFSPAVMVVLGWVNQLQDRFFALSDAQRQNIVRWTAYIGMILGAVTAIGILSRVLVAGMGILRVFATVMGFVFSPIVLYTALAVSAIAGFKLAWETDWLGIRTAAENAWEKIEPILKVLGQDVRAAWEWTVDVAGTAWAWLTETTWTEKVEDVKGWITDGWEWSVDKAGDAWDWFTNIDWVYEWETVKGWLTDGWDWTIKAAGNAWTWLDEKAPAVTEAIGKLHGWLNNTWSWGVNASGAGWEWLQSAVPGEIIELGKARLELTIETAGALYDAVKTGLETGEWAGVWGATADAWREGMKIGLSLFLVAGTAKALLGAITSGLGLATTGAVSLGVPGTLGALTVGITLAEAMEQGSFEDFAANIIAALIAGFAVAGITASPKAGALVFTVVMNLEIGTIAREGLKELWEGRGQGRVQLPSRSVLWSDALHDPTSDAFHRRVEETARVVESAYQRIDEATRELAESLSGRETFFEPVPELGWWDRVTFRLRSLMGFQSGGYTGNGPVDQIAGVVHGQELVIPAPAVKRGLDGILSFLGVPGFQEGRGEGFLRSSLESLRTRVAEEYPDFLPLVESVVQGLDAVSGASEFAQEKWAELMKAIEDGPEAFQDLFDAARKLAEEDEIAARQQDAMNGLMATLLARMPILNDALQGMQVGAAFGPTGMVVGALSGLALQSDMVASAFGMINEILGALANAVGMLLRPLLPLIQVLQAVLVPIFTVLGAVLESMFLPIMPFVFEALKWLGVVVLFVGEVFQRVRGFILDAVGNLVWGLGKFVDTLIGWFSSAGRNLMASGNSLKASADAAYQSAQELADARRDLIGLTYEEAMARAENIEAMEGVTAGLRGIPSGFKYALERFEAATARPAPPNLSSHYVAPAPAPVAASGAGQAQPQVIIQGDVYGWEDFKRKVNQATSENANRVRGSSYGF